MIEMALEGNTMLYRHSPIIHVQEFVMFEWVQTVQTFKVELANNVKATQVFFQSWKFEIREFDGVQNVQTFKVKIINVFRPTTFLLLVIHIFKSI